MRIVIAPDSYKGSLSALEVAKAIERGIKSVLPTADTLLLPIADGGEGTVEAFVQATGGYFEQTAVVGPLGEEVNAVWGILGDGQTAVMEMAAASGITLIPKERLDPLRATTCGTGQMIRAALDKGLRRIIMGIGGSATNDGGSGMATALGAVFLDEQGRELPPGGAALAKLAALDLSGLDSRLAQTTIFIACDVDNPLCGSTGASAVYGPQKGATPAMVAELDAALAQYAKVAGQAVGRKVADVPGAGAAGGLGAGFLLFTPAKLQKGIDMVLREIQFESRLAGARLVFTGEGNTDFQTAFGKAPVGVALLAQKQGIPVVCISGGLGEGYEKVLDRGIDACMSILPGPYKLEECMAAAGEMTEKAAQRVMRLILLGKNLSDAAAKEG